MSDVISITRKTTEAPHKARRKISGRGVVIANPGTGSASVFLSDNVFGLVSVGPAFDTDNKLSELKQALVSMRSTPPEPA